MLAEASVLDAIAGKRVIGISSLAISVSSSGLMLLSEKIIFNKHWVHPVLYGPDLQFLPFSGHGHFGASATLSWVLVGKFGVKKVLLAFIYMVYTLTPWGEMKTDEKTEEDPSFWLVISCGT